MAQNTIQRYIHPWVQRVLKMAVQIYALSVCHIKENLDFEKMINTFDINMNDASFLSKVPQKHLVQCTMKCFLAVMHDMQRQMHFIFGYNLHTNMI